MIDVKHTNLNELSTATRENLRSLGYGDRTIYMVNSIWRDLEQFLGNRSNSPFLPIYGLEYLHERIGYPECLQRKLTPDERDYTLLPNRHKNLLFRFVHLKHSFSYVLPIGYIYPLDSSKVRLQQSHL